MLKELILKEFKDLVRDPRIWIPFIISALVLPLTGLIVSRWYEGVYIRDSNTF
jgi:ABC-2 type transport system permease protein